MAGTSYRIIDNTDLVRNATDDAIEKALEEIGITAEAYAKLIATQKHIVDTGRLRNSITHAVNMDEKAVYIGTNVEYAPYVELGTGKYVQGGRQTPWKYKDEKGWHVTSGMPPRPFLKPAATEHVDEYKDMFKKSLENA